jgi:hypothetical protein
MLGILFGAGVTLAAGAAVLTLVVTPKTAAAIANAKSAQKQADDVRWSDAMKMANDISAANTRRMLATQQIVDTASQPEGYTSLIEPAPAGSPALQLFDIVRPGLGTMLAKMQAAQSPQIAVRWVIPGHVKPMTNSRGYSYCWLNANGEVDAANCPAANQ